MEPGNNKCDCTDCQLRSLFFANVTLSDLTNICEIKKERKYLKGAPIITEGGKIDEFLYMKEGLVKLSKKTADGRDQIISFAKPFDFVSLLSIFSSDVYKYSVIAIDDTVVCNLDLEQVMSNARKNALFTLDLMTRVSEANDKIIHENLEIKRRNLKGRVAYVLLYFSQHIFEADEFELPVSRREIAEYIGMSTENVIRALSEFRNDRIIKIFGKDILIADRERLEKISDFG